MEDDILSTPRALLVLFSYHHQSTEKVAKAMASALGCEIAWPQDVDPDALLDYDLVGFGSGIYDDKHHQSLLELAESMAPADGGNAFLFSTSFDTDLRKVGQALRERLEAKGYAIVGEYNSAGFNTNSFLKWFGGLNKGRPNADDLARAESFARELRDRVVRGDTAQPLLSPQT
jgi:flavodoxin